MVAVTITMPATERVVNLYKAACGQLADDLPASCVLRLPPITAAGLDAAGAAVRVRHELAVAVGLIVQRANGFPAASRKRRVLSGLSKWCPGVPGWVKGQERWFSTIVVRDVAAASAGTATPPEVAGLIALSILNPA